VMRVAPIVRLVDWIGSASDLLCNVDVMTVGHSLDQKSR
jgi:hypothetical protein